MAIKEYIKGSILDAPQTIAHGVNCQNKMGSGVAKVLFKKYPLVKSEYHKFCPKFKMLLGKIQIVKVEDGSTVVNCFTQEFYGYDGKKRVSYDAIYDCFSTLAGIYDEIAIPKIGCGLAGGNWNIVKQIIDDATGEDLDVYVYHLE